MLSTTLPDLKKEQKHLTSQQIFSLEGRRTSHNYSRVTLLYNIWLPHFWEQIHSHNCINAFNIPPSHDWFSKISVFFFCFAAFFFSFVSSCTLFWLALFALTQRSNTQRTCCDFLLPWFHLYTELSGIMKKVRDCFSVIWETVDSMKFPALGYFIGKQYLTLFLKSCWRNTQTCQKVHGNIIFISFSQKYCNKNQVI